MKTARLLITVLGVGALFLSGPPAVSLAGGGQGKGGQMSGKATTVKGELLRIDGEIYVVKDQAGKEVRLHVDRSTQKSGSLNPGETVRARITEDGHALSIQHAQPDAGMGRTPPGEGMGQ